MQDVKKIKCELCHAAFTKLSNYTRHMLTHVVSSNVSNMCSVAIAFIQQYCLVIVDKKIHLQLCKI